jgi:hypothetical protein
MARDEELGIEVILVRMGLQTEANPFEGNAVVEGSSSDVRTKVDEQRVVDEN